MGHKQYIGLSLGLFMAFTLPIRAMALSYDEIMLLVQAEKKAFGQVNNSQSFDDRIKALEVNSLGSTGSGTDSQRLKTVCRKLGLLPAEAPAQSEAKIKSGTREQSLSKDIKEPTAEARNSKGLKAHMERLPATQLGAKPRTDSSVSPGIGSGTKPRNEHVPVAQLTAKPRKVPLATVATSAEARPSVSTAPIATTALERQEDNGVELKNKNDPKLDQKTISQESTQTNSKNQLDGASSESQPQTPSDQTSTKDNVQGESAPSHNDESLPTATQNNQEIGTSTSTPVSADSSRPDKATVAPSNQEQGRSIIGFVLIAIALLVTLVIATAMFVKKLGQRQERTDTEIDDDEESRFPHRNHGQKPASGFSNASDSPQTNHDFQADVEDNAEKYGHLRSFLSSIAESSAEVSQGNEVGHTDVSRHSEVIHTSEEQVPVYAQVSNSNPESYASASVTGSRPTITDPDPHSFSIAHLSPVQSSSSSAPSPASAVVPDTVKSINHEQFASAEPLQSDIAIQTLGHVLSQVAAQSSPQSQSQQAQQSTAQVLESPPQLNQSSAQVNGLLAQLNQSSAQTNESSHVQSQAAPPPIPRFRSAQDFLSEEQKSIVLYKACLVCGAWFSLDANVCDNDNSQLEIRDLERAVLSAFGQRYEINSVIGSGGMSIVLKATDKFLSRPVALKQFTPHLISDAAAVARFEREAELVSRLKHPNIVTVHDFGITSNGIPYISMDFVAGKTLAKTLSQFGAIYPARAKRILLQCVSGLNHAHQQGIIHRDLKPQNIILENDSVDDDLVKIVDFGIAKLLSDQNMYKLTKSGELMGTTAYMSPEYCRNQNLDARSDIYSLGCIMFETLTGQLPFAGGTEIETLQMIVSAETPSLSDCRPDIFGLSKFETIVNKALAKDPNDRYQATNELLPTW